MVMHNVLIISIEFLVMVMHLSATHGNTNDARNRYKRTEIDIFFSFAIVTEQLVLVLLLLPGP